MNLSKYFTNNASVYNIPCAPIGQYDLLVASKGNVQINVNVSQQLPFLAGKLKNFVRPSRIRFENRVHKQQTLFKWNRRYFFFSIFKFILNIILQDFYQKLN